MLEIASTLSYSEFDDIKDENTTKKMRENLAKIYGGDNNVLRRRSKRLRGNFSDIVMSPFQIIKNNNLF